MLIHQGLTFYGRKIPVSDGRAQARKESRDNWKERCTTVSPNRARMNNTKALHCAHTVQCSVTASAAIFRPTPVCLPQCRSRALTRRTCPGYTLHAHATKCSVRRGICDACVQAVQRLAANRDHVGDSHWRAQDHLANRRQTPHGFSSPAPCRLRGSHSKRAALHLQHHGSTMRHLIRISP